MTKTQKPVFFVHRACKMVSGRPMDGVWSQWTKEFDRAGHLQRVQCKACLHVLRPHATRMREHLQKCLANLAVPQPTTELAVSVSSSSSTIASTMNSTGSMQRKRTLSQTTVASYADSRLSKQEADVALGALAIAAMHNGWSHHSICSKSAVTFYKTLRVDFTMPTPFKIRKAQDQLYLDVKERVERILKAAAFGHMCLDFWEDHHKCPTLGVTLLVSFKPFLVHFERFEDREFEKNLVEAFTNVIEYIRSVSNLRIYSIISENASNMLAATRTVSAEQGLVQLHCLAHSANLLLSDIVKLFTDVHDQCRQVVSFFTDCHYPRCATLPYYNLSPPFLFFRMQYLARKEALNIVIQAW